LSYIQIGFIVELLFFPNGRCPVDCCGTYVHWGILAVSGWDHQWNKYLQPYRFRRHTENENCWL